jgi:hypothetical protein
MAGYYQVKADYARIRALGVEYLSRQPRSVAL